jgi:hypothetical protein
VTNLELPNQPSALPARPRGPLFSMRTRRIIKMALIYALLIALAVPFLLPFLWMIATSL